MRFRSWLPVLGYGTLAAALLACLWLISLVPLRTQWGRELTGAAVAIVALVVGLRLAQRPPPMQGPAPEAGVVAATAAPSSPRDVPTLLSDPTPGDAAAGSTIPDDAGLSMREREVLRLLAEGLSNKALARALGVSENTIKTHLANVYAKLGVGKRTEALAAARRLGLDRHG